MSFDVTANVVAPATLADYTRPELIVPRLRERDTAGIITGLSVSTVATATSNVGTYAINASGGSAVSVAGQAYRFIDAPGTLTITPRSITVTADAKSRAYGDANPALT